MLQDVPRLVRGMAVAGIKSGVPQEQRERFLLVFSGEKELKEAVGFDRPNDAYLILIDADGAIRWRFHGELNDSSPAELKTHLADLQKVPLPVAGALQIHQAVRRALAELRTAA